MRGIKYLGTVLVIIAGILGIIFSATDAFVTSTAVGVWSVIFSVVMLILGLISFTNAKATSLSLFVISFILSIITMNFSVNAVEDTMILMIIGSIIGFIGALAPQGSAQKSHA